MGNKTIKIFLLLFAISYMLYAAPARALRFDPNFIISDFDLFDKDSMTLGGIQNFLDKRASLVANLTDTLNGALKKASEIIYGLAQQYAVSPKFLLAKLQHEQGLIEKSSASQNAIDWATGFSCFNNTCNEKYRGFANQVEATAASQRIYAQTPEKFKFRAGVTSKTNDGFDVTPANQATANLYIYTPYQGGVNGVGGNRAFWNVWTRYFGLARYPDGTALMDPSGDFWLIQNGERRKYLSQSTFLSSHGADEAINVGDDVLGSYEIGPPIKFPEFSLVRLPNAEIYLLVGQEKRKIKDEETFRVLGFNPEELIQAEAADLDLYQVGFPIGPKAVYPQGALLQDRKSGGIFFVQDGIKHPIIDRTIWEINFKKAKPLTPSESEFKLYELGDPVKLKDGIFVRGDNGKIYIISKGVRLPIASEVVFKKLFGESKLQAAITVPNKVLALHKIGDTIDIPGLEEAAITPTLTPTTSPVLPPFLGLWESSEIPTFFAPNQVAQAKIQFRNRGLEPWTEQNTKLVITPAVFEAQDVKLESPTNTNQVATFNFSLKAPTKPGTHKVRFELENIKGASMESTIQVGADYSAEIISRKFPIAVKNTWSRAPVEFIIKNNGTQNWTTRRIGLKVSNVDKDELSPFYDPIDWISKEIAAAPIEKLPLIKPGEKATLHFTLKTRKLKTETYQLKLRLEARDKNEVILLDGQKELILPLRVDK